MTDAAFTPAARRAILTANLDTCAGCLTPRNLEAQHRRARGAGGSTRTDLGEAPNGVALCRRCHDWTEHHPRHARALGWRLDPGDDPVDVPYWTRRGWRRWTLTDDDGTPLVEWLATGDVPGRRPGDVPAAIAALDRHSRPARG